MNMLYALPLAMGVPGGAAGAGGSGSMATTLLTFGAVFAIFYFLIIRPQNKRQKETKNMLANLRKGDRVVTIGGIRGSIVSLKEDSAVLKVDDNTKIQFSRSAISSVVDRKAGSAPPAEADDADADETDS